MLRIGCHLSSVKGFLHMAQEAQSIGANTFQYFTRNPRGGARRAIDARDVAAYREFAAAHDIAHIMGYAPYTADPATSDMQKRDFTLMMMAEDLAFMEEIPGQMYLLRPGSARGVSVEQGCDNVAAAILQTCPPHATTRIVLDTMSGEGEQVGYKFEQLARIINEVGKVGAPAHRRPHRGSAGAAQAAGGAQAASGAQAAGGSQAAGAPQAAGGAQAAGGSQAASVPQAASAAQAASDPQAVGAQGAAGGSPAATFPTFAAQDVGVCMDLAAVWAAGYDVVGDLNGVLDAFDRTVGLERLCAVHLNDSKEPLGARVDRHARIGEGRIGFDAILALMRHPALSHLPFYLEEYDSTLVIYEHDIARLKAAYK